MAGTTEPPTTSTLLAAFTSFLTVSIHTLLSHRSLYPSTTFLTSRAYNYPVRQSRHPGLCTWITDAVSAIHSLLLSGSLASISLIILSPSESGQQPLERYVWDVSRFPVVNKADLHKPLLRPGGGEEALVDLEEQFRGVLARMAGLEGRLKPLPEGCSFNIAVEVREEGEPPVGHPQPWIPVVPGLQRYKGGVGEGKKGEDLGGVRTTPIRAVEAGEMVFEMWVEEGRAKMEMGAKEGSQASAV